MAGMKAWNGLELLPYFKKISRNLFRIKEECLVLSFDIQPFLFKGKLFSFLIHLIQNTEHLI